MSYLFPLLPDKKPSPPATEARAWTKGHNRRPKASSPIKPLGGDHQKDKPKDKAHLQHEAPKAIFGVLLQAW